MRVEWKDKAEWNLHQIEAYIFDRFGPDSLERGQPALRRRDTHRPSRVIINDNTTRRFYRVQFDTFRAGIS